MQQRMEESENEVQHLKGIGISKEQVWEWATQERLTYR